MGNDLPNSKHARAQWHDYNGGLYFVTFCVKDMRHSLGKISDGQMYYSRVGEVANNEICKLLARTGYAEALKHVVMPNHIHLIVYISASDNHFDASCQHINKLGGFHSLLSTAIGCLKAGIKRFANCNGIHFEWQSGFHDHIIRDSYEHQMISDYIDSNITTWETDRYFRTILNRKL